MRPGFVPELGDWELGTRVGRSNDPSGGASVPTSPSFAPSLVRPWLVLVRATIPRLRLMVRTMMGLGPLVRARLTGVPWMVSAPMILPRVVLTRFLAAGWDLTRLVGRFAAADRASLSSPPMSFAPAVTARGRCPIRRRPLATLPVRRLAGKGTAVARLLHPGGGMGLWSTRCTGSVGAAATVRCFAPVLLGRGRTDASRLLALMTRLGPAPRPHRTGGVRAPRRLPPGPPDAFRTSAGRPMVLSLPLTTIPSRGTFMRPSTRCGACARATLSG